MIASLIAALLAAQNAAPAPAWTWTLYEDAAPIVLANEVPDTPQLRATLECEPGSSVASIVLYGAAPEAGMARVTSGEASAMAQSEVQRGDRLKVTLPSDHPVFAAFAADGRLSITVAEQRRAIEVPRVHLAKLRRFAELCSG